MGDGVLAGVGVWAGVGVLLVVEVLVGGGKEGVGLSESILGVPDGHGAGGRLPTTFGIGVGRAVAVGVGVGGAGLGDGVVVGDCSASAVGDDTGVAIGAGVSVDPSSLAPELGARDRTT